MTYLKSAENADYAAIVPSLDSAVLDSLENFPPIKFYRITLVKKVSRNVGARWEFDGAACEYF